MSIINNPFLALLALAGFIWLAGYSWEQPVVVVPKDKQEGYTQGANSFVGFKLAHYAEVHTYHMSPSERQHALNSLYGDAQ